jgi:hypothetical protein
MTVARHGAIRQPQVTENAQTPLGENRFETETS